MASTSDSELKGRHRKMWAAGDYASMVELWLLPLGPRLVEACGIESGMRVLDVAAGSGNASIPAAKTGASVTASDLTPELLEAGRARAESAGLELEWVEADAENLPFEQGSFDVVISAIGAMFAPHHQQAADELEAHATGSRPAEPRCGPVRRCHGSSLPVRLHVCKRLQKRGLRVKLVPLLQTIASGGSRWASTATA